MLRDALEEPGPGTEAVPGCLLLSCCTSGGQGRLLGGSDVTWEAFISRIGSVLVFPSSLRQDLALTSSWFFFRPIISSFRDSNCISRSDLLRVRLSNKGRRVLMSASTFCRRPYSVSYLHQGEGRNVSPSLGLSVLLLLTLFTKKITYCGVSVPAFVPVLCSKQHLSTSRIMKALT